MGPPLARQWPPDWLTNGPPTGSPMVPRLARQWSPDWLANGPPDWLAHRPHHWLAHAPTHGLASSPARLRGRFPPFATRFHPAPPEVARASSRCLDTRSGPTLPRQPVPRLPSAARGLVPAQAPPRPTAPGGPRSWGPYVPAPSRSRPMPSPPPLEGGRPPYSVSCAASCATACCYRPPPGSPSPGRRRSGRGAR
jgi:hypothetical protein